MFNRPVNVTVAPMRIDANFSVTEKRAPTDESVKLLREMEAAARAEVLKAVAIDTNEIRGVLHKGYDAMSDRWRSKMIADFNGIRLVAEVSAAGRDESCLAGPLVQAFADEIARHVLLKAVNGALPAPAKDAAPAKP